MNSAALRARAAFLGCPHAKPHEALHGVERGGLLITAWDDERHPAGCTSVAPSFILPAMVELDCFRFRSCQDHLNPESAFLLLAATAADGPSLLSTGATRQHRNSLSPASRAVVLPLISEQCATIQHIGDQATFLFDGIGGIAERETSLRHEYGTHLIAEVVSGKLDIREAAARWPDEAEDPALDEVGSATEGQDDTADDLDMTLKDAEA